MNQAHLINNTKKTKYGMSPDNEFYTRMEDIERELIQYKNEFTDKIVYCNADSEISNFVKFFKSDKFNIKELIHTSDDFRSPRNIENLIRADIVVTNPPFSLFIEYFNTLIKHNKKFLIVAPLLSVGYNNVFEHLKNKNIKCGLYEIFKFENTEKQSRCIWLTNLSTPIELKKLPISKTYDENYYRKYDNFDQIEVGKMRDIPKDYDGVMGVPVTFFRHNYDGYDILRKSEKCRIDGRWIFKRIFVQKRSSGDHRQ